VPNVLIIILRYLFLLVLYLFLIYTLVQMFRFLKYQDRTQNQHDGAKENNSEAQLVKINEGELPRIYPLKDSLNIGRHDDNDVVIADSKASRHHARIYNNHGQYWIEDLKSKNGIYLNDIKLCGPVVLADEDKLSIGNVTFVFVRWGHEVEQGDTRWAGAQC